MNRLSQDIYCRKNQFIDSKSILKNYNKINDSNTQTDINDNILDEIINNENAINNNFIKNLINKNNLNKVEDIPNINDIYWLYFKHLKKNNSNIKYLTRIIYIIGIIYLSFGFLSPNKLLKYHIMWCLKTLFIWEVFNKKNYILLLEQYLFGYSNHNNLIPVSFYICKLSVIIVMMISIYGIINPIYSPFSIIKKIIDNLTIYN